SGPGGAVPAAAPAGSGPGGAAPVDSLCAPSAGGAVPPGAPCLPPARYLVMSSSAAVGPPWRPGMLIAILRVLQVAVRVRTDVSRSMPITGGIVGAGGAFRRFILIPGVIRGGFLAGTRGTAPDGPAHRGEQESAERD